MSTLIIQSVPGRMIEPALEVASDGQNGFLPQACDMVQQRVKDLFATDANVGSLWLDSAITASHRYLVPPIPDRTTPLPKIIEALRTITLLEGLTTEEYTWIATHGVEHITQRGAVIFREGEPICNMTFILRGEIQIRRRNDGPIAVFVRGAGQTAGLLPFSRMKNHGGDGISTGSAWALYIHKDLFPEMLAAIPSMGQRCIIAMVDRVREETRIEQQGQKFNSSCWCTKRKTRAKHKP
jgi:hypothetical protein